MTFDVEVFPDDEYVRDASRRIMADMPRSGAFVLTGGTTAARIYRHLSLDSPLDVFFSDERCVPPDADESNFRMADELLLDGSPARVHRMRGELPPEKAADEHHEEIAPFVKRGFELMLLGMGADCHVGALFPGSPALAVQDRYCSSVDRPDGMKGLTLTPPAMLAATTILVPVSGSGKAAAVRRAVNGDEDLSACPVRLLKDHPDATLLLDQAAASLL